MSNSGAVTLTNDHLMIPVGSLMDSLDDEAKGTLALYLLTDERFLQGVMDQVVDGGTDDPQGRWWSAPDACIQELREKLCERLPAIAERAVKNLIHANEAAHTRARQYEHWAWQMHHKWVHTQNAPCPPVPAWVPTPYPSDDEAQRVLAGGDIENA